MAIEIVSFPYLKWWFPSIFHSYVSLPEGDWDKAACNWDLLTKITYELLIWMIFQKGMIIYGDLHNHQNRSSYGWLVPDCGAWKAWKFLLRWVEARDMVGVCDPQHLKMHKTIKHMYCMNLSVWCKDRVSETENVCSYWILMNCVLNTPFDRPVHFEYSCTYNV